MLRFHPAIIATPLLLAAAVLAQQPELIVIKETGPRARRVNVAVVCDGYTVAQKDLCIADMKVFSDATVSQDPPLSLYVNYFNIYGVWVPSNESGADQNGVMVDTYFGAAYSPSLDRLLTVNSSKMLTTIRQLVPEVDMQFAVVNSADYGGSGGAVAVANRTTPAIVAHEVGHSFAKLGDEYDYAGSSPFEAPNTTKTNTRSVKWGTWIDAATPVPTPETAPYTNVIGVFEGAAYNPVGWFRPKQNCRMRANGIPFCSVCAEAYIVTTYDKISPVDSFLPPNASPVAFKDVPVKLDVVPMKPSTHALKITWKVDGVAAPGITGGSFLQALPTGSHRVTALVSDTTGLVRNDPDGVLSDSVAWRVEASGIVGIASAPPAANALLRVDSRGLAFRLQAAGPFQVKVVAVGGRTLQVLSGSGVPGANAQAWREGTLGPGRYLVMLESGGKSLRRWWTVR